MPLTETTPEAYLDAENWRFVLMPDHSVRVLSRSPWQMTNAAMQTFCAEHGLEIASSAEIRAAHIPFDQTGLRPEKAFRYPWGNETDLSDQSTLFRDKDVSLGGLKRFGPSRHGLWAVTREGERVGGAYNILYNSNGTPNATHQGGERCDLSGKRAELGSAEGAPIIRPAGFFARNAEGEPRPLELHENEGYFFSRAATAAEAAYLHQVLPAIGEKLTGDDGILILTPPDFTTKKGLFGAGGGCHSCLRRGGLTYQVQKNAIFNATGIEIGLLPEYQEELAAATAKPTFTMQETRALQGLLNLAQSGAVSSDSFAMMREQVLATFPETDQSKLTDKLTRMLEQTPHLAQFLPVDVQPGQARDEQRGL